MASTPPGFSPYPRQGVGVQSPDTRPPGVYFDTIGKAWELIKQDTATWALTTLAVFIIFYAVNFAFTIVGGMMLGLPTALGRTPDLDVGAIWRMVGINTLLALIPAGLFAALMGGMLNMAFKKLEGQPIQITDAFEKLKSFPVYLGANTLMTIAIYIGTLLLIIPGLFLAGALSMVLALVTKQNLGVLDSLSSSYNTVKSFAFPMFALLFVLGLIQVVGMLACGIGILFTFPIYIVVLAMHYNWFFPTGVTAPTNWERVPEQSS